MKEEKIRIVIEGLRGEYSFADLCRKEGIHPNLFYNWSRDFMEAGKRRLAGDTKRDATSGEVQSLKNKNTELIEILADLTLELQRAKKTSMVSSKLQVHASQYE